MTYVRAFYDTMKFLIEEEKFILPPYFKEDFDLYQKTRNFYFPYPNFGLVRLLKNTKEYMIEARLIHPYVVKEGEFPCLEIAEYRKDDPSGTKPFTRKLRINDFHDLLNYSGVLRKYKEKR